jgi:hypothetical protein
MPDGVAELAYEVDGESVELVGKPGLDLAQVVDEFDLGIAHAAGGIDRVGLADPSHLSTDPGEPIAMAGADPVELRLQLAPQGVARVDVAQPDRFDPDDRLGMTIASPVGQSVETKAMHVQHEDLAEA